MIMEYCKFYNKIKGKQKEAPVREPLSFPNRQKEGTKTENVKIYLLASKSVAEVSSFRLFQKARINIVLSSWQ